MSKFEFVLLSIGVPVALVTWLYRTKAVEEATSLCWIGVGAWIFLMSGLSWSFLNKVNVPFGGEIAHHVHSIEELGLVIGVTYCFGFGLLVPLAALIGFSAGLVVAELKKGSRSE